MDQAIRDFPKQFDYLPVVKNPEKLTSQKKFLVCAMGGSAHSSALLKIVHPDFDIIVHRGYGLPKLPPQELESRFIIVISYSGNTEEPIDAYVTARKAGLPVGVIAKGGRLIELAEADKTPYVQIPDTGIQPRNALGFTLRAQLAMMQEPAHLEETAKLRDKLVCNTCEQEGRALAQRLKNKVPIIYASSVNEYLAYVWKIKFNETGKVPAYREVFSELNHNEMQGYYVQDATRELSKNFYFLFLRDKNDHPRIQKRMDVTKSLYKERGLVVEDIEVHGGHPWLRIFTSLYIADWAAYYLATGYGADPEKVEMIEAFKKEIL